MRLINISITNFLSYRDNQSIRLAERGLVRIEGINKDDASVSSNGTGKTGIVDAIKWVLFGTTTHDKPPVGDDVINEDAGNNCCVGLIFEHEDQSYRVTRGRKCSGGRKVMLGGRSNGLHLIRLSLTEEEVLSGRTTKATQAKLEQIIGMSASTFHNAVLFGQSRSYRFSTLTDSEKKAVLDEIIGAEVYAKAAKVARDRLGGVNYKTLAAESGLTHALKLLATTDEHLDSLETTRTEHEERKEAERKDLEHELRSVREQIDQGDRDNERLERFAAKLVTLETELDACRESCVLLATKEMSADANLITAKRAVAETRRSLVSVKKTGTGMCTQCNQVITAASLSAHTKELEDSVTKQIAKVKKLKRVAQGHTDEADAQRSIGEKISARIASISLKMRKLITAEEFMRTQKTEARLVLKLDALEEETGIGLRDELRNLRMKHDMYNAEAEADEDALYNLEQEERALTFWLEAFGTRGIRSLLLDNVLPFLNARLELYANVLTDGNLELEFSTEREKKGGGTVDEFSIVMTNKHGSDSYNLNSFGQRAKADLCIGLALQDLAASKSAHRCNVAFFDEPFESLDEVAMDRVISLLTNELGDRESVFVITHQDALKTFIPATITVTYEDGASTIEDDA